MHPHGQVQSGTPHCHCNWPTQWPQDHELSLFTARRKRLPYRVPIRLITTNTRNGKVTSNEDSCSIGFLPAQAQCPAVCLAGRMSKKERVAAGECPHDLGAYFIPSSTGCHYMFKNRWPTAAHCVGHSPFTFFGHSEYDTPNQVRVRQAPVGTSKSSSKDDRKVANA